MIGASPEDLKEGGYLVDRLPDVWNTKDSTQEIGDGLFRLFETLARKRQSGRTFDLLPSYPFSESAPNPSDNTYMTALPPPYALTGVSGGAALEEDLAATGTPSSSIRSVSSSSSKLAFTYPTFQRTREGSNMLMFVSTLHTARTSSWRKGVTAALSTAVLVIFAKVFGGSNGNGKVAAEEDGEEYEDEDEDEIRIEDYVNLDHI